MEKHHVQGLDALPPDVRGGVLTIGNFDGVHLGHRRILRAARELADADGAAVAAMTFDPPPDLVLRPDDAPRRVVPPRRKGRMLRQAGCDWVVTVRPTIELMALEPGEFIEQVIRRRFAPRHVVEGPNFRFGRRRAGDVDTLRGAGARAGFAVHAAEAVRVTLGDAERVVSSTLIRDLVAAGRVADAARCLGRDFALFGRVVRGRGVGRELDYPTANLAAGEQVCPGDGVYAGRAVVAGRRFAAAVSVGTQPTFADGRRGGRTVEAYLLDASGDYYGREMELRFARRLRDQRRYDSAEALKAQMAKDVDRVRDICR